MKLLCRYACFVVVFVLCVEVGCLDGLKPVYIDLPGGYVLTRDYASHYIIRSPLYISEEEYMLCKEESEDFEKIKDRYTVIKVPEGVDEEQYIGNGNGLEWVKQYNVYGNLIIGRGQKPKDFSKDEPPLEDLDYFIIDVAKAPAKHLMLFQDNSAWLEKLKEYGITEEPVLKRPPRYREWKREIAMDTH